MVEFGRSKSRFKVSERYFPEAECQLRERKREQESERKRASVVAPWRKKSGSD